MNPFKTEAIRLILNHRAPADLAKLYTPEMEVQYNVAQDGGTRIEGDYKGRLWTGWTDGLTTWKSGRIPYNANTDPTFDDRRMTFDLGEHVEAIGMTGWNWVQKKSMWVAFDFDAITGHSDKHQRKLMPDELAALESAVQNVPWVTLRKSTGGKGLHLYVFLDGTVETLNHNEHAAVARFILGKLSAQTGFDFDSKVDICGQNMWVWARRVSVENQGLKLLKQGDVLESIPEYWRDHVKVIVGHRKKTLPRFFNDDTPALTKFEELASQVSRFALDDEHRKLLLWIEQHAKGGWWDNDNCMLVTHTYWLAVAHNDLSLKGTFKTLSKGNEAPSDINVFCYPLRQGGWVVRRYSLGAMEDSTWEQDAKGWTRCYYNCEPTLKSTARANGGIEDPKGGFIFSEAALALETARILGANVPELPTALNKASTKLKKHQDGRLIVEINSEHGAVSRHEMKDWLEKKGIWTRIFNIQEPTNIGDSENVVLDEQLRHITTETGQDAGWVVKGERSQWREEPLKHVMLMLESIGIHNKDLKNTLGTSLTRCWTLINRPFASEYLGNRTWNRESAQFRFMPSQTEELNYPNWLKILNHVGKSLDNDIRNHPWAIANAVLTGADYLKLWLASLFKEPLEPLPYLFLYGNQNSGKSIFHEAVSLLLTRGVERADIALRNTCGFNYELATAVLCIIEELDLKRDKDAANRIKDYVTSRRITIHKKQQTPYSIANSLHFVQCSNSREACPVFPGDTRTTVIYVEDLQPQDKIPKKLFLPMLEKEAPDFLAELLRLEIPASNDRLNIPVIETADKTEIETTNKTAVELFLDTCYRVDGEMILYRELYAKFYESLPPDDRSFWTIIKFGKELPSHFPKGRTQQSGAEFYVGNISLTAPGDGATPKPKYRAVKSPTSNNVFLVRGDT